MMNLTCLAVLTPPVEQYALPTLTSRSKIKFLHLKVGQMSCAFQRSTSHVNACQSASPGGGRGKVLSAHKGKMGFFQRKTRSYLFCFPNHCITFVWVAATGLSGQRTTGRLDKRSIVFYETFEPFCRPCKFTSLVSQKTITNYFFNNANTHKTFFLSEVKYSLKCCWFKF